MSKKLNQSFWGLVEKVNYQKLRFHGVQFLKFVLYSGSFFLFAYAVLLVVRVFVRRDLVPDVSVPVSRFVADIDFETRTVELDSTISKIYGSPKDITIWRFSDGTTIKNTSTEDIEKNEIITHTFDEPGRYSIGYSIIDEDNLSDEAVCTLSFKEESDKETEGDKEEHTLSAESADWVSSECGKSYTQYNSSDQIYDINVNKRYIRQAIYYALIAILITSYTKLFIKTKPKVQNEKK
jgi:hypothetical protein